jgi:hypothetical protein
VSFDNNKNYRKPAKKSSNFQPNLKQFPVLFLNLLPQASLPDYFSNIYTMENPLSVRPAAPIIFQPYGISLLLY